MQNGIEKPCAMASTGANSPWIAILVTNGGTMGGKRELSLRGGICC
jgi:hypothetical protein